jgi:hypothetical protein
MPQVRSNFFRHKKNRVKINDARTYKKVKEIQDSDL